MRAETLYNTAIFVVCLTSTFVVGGCQRSELASRPEITTPPAVQALEQLHASVSSLPACVVHINTLNRDGSESFGTGVLVAQDTLLTAHHVVSDAETINIVFGGRSDQPRIDVAYQQQIVADIWDDLDLAMLTGFVSPPWAEPITIAHNRPYTGDPVTTIGLDRPTGVRIRSGHVCGAERFDQRFQICVADWFGDSGGPVINAAGELVGINSEIGEISHFSVESRIDVLTQMTYFFTNEWSEQGTIAVDVTGLNLFGDLVQ